MKILRIFKTEHTEDTMEDDVDAQDVIELLNRAGKVVRYKSAVWQWFMYEVPKHMSKFEYELLYIPADVYAIKNGVEIDLDEKRFARDQKCSCGSDKLGHPGHSIWCFKFKKY